MRLRIWARAEAKKHELEMPPQQCSPDIARFDRARDMFHFKNERGGQGGGYDPGIQAAVFAARRFRRGKRPAQHLRIHVWPLIALPLESLKADLDKLPLTGGYYFLIGESENLHTQTDSWRSILNDLFKTDIHDFHPHRFRHTRVVEWLAHGLNFEEIAGMIGEPFHSVVEDNAWRRHIEPMRIGQVSGACAQLMPASATMPGFDPKVAADQRGHGIGVAIDVYTTAAPSRRAEAAEPGRKCRSHRLTE